jgi:hypothetical protein
LVAIRRAFIAVAAPLPINRMLGQPGFVLEKATQRQFDLPTCVAFGSRRQRPCKPEHLAAQLKKFLHGVAALIVEQFGCGEGTSASWISRHDAAVPSCFAGQFCSLTEIARMPIK